MERNFSIDAMKTVSTFMVCFIHFNGFSYKNIEWWNGVEGSISYAFLTVCSCAVPVFLIINGYLIINNRYDTKVYIQKGIKSFILATVWILIYNVAFNQFFHEGRKWKEIEYNLYHGIYHGEYIGIRNWFFYTLAIIYFLSPFIKKIFLDGQRSLIIYMFMFPCFFVWTGDLLQKISGIICAGG